MTPVSAPGRATDFTGDLCASTIGIVLRPIQALIAGPSLLFLGTLTLMLFHPFGALVPAFDRFAFGMLLFAMFLRACLLREPIGLRGPIILPLMILTAWACTEALMQPYSAETWSIVAAKWLVPLGLYLAASRIFREPDQLRHFEVFTWLTLGYLSAMAILFMIGARECIFPRFILDESLGIHADRARGPFLQAVANGVALNLLGLLALDSFRRRRLRGVPAVVLLTGLPLAIIATKTRAVWLSFAASIVALPFLTADRRLRRACLLMCAGGVLSLFAIYAFTDGHRSLAERLEENGPVKFRMAVYEAGWEMFLKKPILGWGASAMQTELSRRISDFHQEQYYFHNTYLEILVQSGMLGLALYLWVIVDVFRVGRDRGSSLSSGGCFLDRDFRSLWPLIVAVYLVNASFVVMNYQFVNGVLFTLAGMLRAQHRGEALHVVH